MVASLPSQCTNPACALRENAIDTTNTCDLSERCANACAAYGRVCPCAARAAGRAACNAIKKLSDNSLIFHGKPDFCTIDCDDMVIGIKLGEGGFSVVHEVVMQAGERQGQTFAVKYLKRKVMVNQHEFELGAADLAIEANFLATLKHPTIVTLHGVTAGSVETNVASGKECGFFIVIDRLYDTLERRIEKWKEESEKNSGGMMYRLSHDFREKRKAALDERLKAAYEIADVMQYLHSQNIVFRDLKPDNIGYDKEGKLKLFDFGLAKELKPGSEGADGKYKMTGNTGSRRYMAPEVAKEISYDLTVDVYSFGILLWELCSMDKPFHAFSSGKHMQQVVMGGERPRLDTPSTSWLPMNLQWLLKKCWSAFPVSRPSFEGIKSTLQDIISGNQCIPANEVHGTPLSPPTGGFASMRKASRLRNRTTGDDSPLKSLLTNSPSLKKDVDFTTIPKAVPPSRLTKSFGFLKGNQSPSH